MLKNRAFSMKLKDISAQLKLKSSFYFVKCYRAFHEMISLSYAVPMLKNWAFLYEIERYFYTTQTKNQLILSKNALEGAIEYYNAI
jgi:hypothetical protein